MKTDIKRLPALVRAGLLLLAMVFAPFISWAQGDGLQFHHLLRGEGIATGSIEAIYQDSYGYIWFGGLSGIGIVQYDGVNYTVHAPGKRDEHRISNGVIWDIFEDKTGDLWFATDEGLNRFDRELGRFSRFIPGDDPAFSRAIAEDLEGTLWVGFIGGLGRFDRETETFRFYYQDPDYPGSGLDNIRSLYADQNGDLWIGTDLEGLSHFDTETEQFTRVWPLPENAPSGLTGSSVVAIHQTDDGVIWAGTAHGLLRLNPATGRVKTFRADPEDPQSLQSDVVNVITEAPDGNLWIGTEYGLHYLDRDTETFTVSMADPANPHSMAHNIVRSLHVDNTGSLWLGNFPSGISFLDHVSLFFRTYNHDPREKNSLNNNSVLSLREGDAGNLLIGTDGGGLNYYDRELKTFTHFEHEPDNPQSLSSPAVLDIESAPDGKWWLGTWGGGLNLFDPVTEQFAQFRLNAAYPAAQNVWTVLHDSRDTLWIGTTGAGLGRYDNEKETFVWYTPDTSDVDGMPSYVVWTLYEDHQGHVWLGTNGGLARYLPESDGFVTYRHDVDDPSSLSSDSVTDIVEDDRSRLWVATRDGGLNLYDSATETFTRVNQQHGLPTDSVVSVVPDGLGNLWLGTNTGLSRYTPETDEVLNFGGRDGSASTEYNIGSGIRMRSGELVFGGIEGFTLLDPENFESREAAPPVAIVRFEIFNEPVPVGEPGSPLSKTISHTDTITLTHKESVFSFHFVALSYSNPGRNQYAYMLEGFENQWNYIGNRRTATYTNLDAGNYVFRVKASNSQGVWNEEGQSIHVRILPPPWETWWAYSIYAIIIALIIAAIVRAQHQKVENQRRVNRELEQKVVERTEALQQNNQELENAYRKLEEISLSDPLTGLNNRRYLRNLVPKEVAEVQRSNYSEGGAPVAQGETRANLLFVLLDLDHFKLVNDTHGHAAGDQVLVQLAEVLKRVCRNSDLLVRWGGEEFLVVSRVPDRRDAPRLPERIRRAVAEHAFTIPDGKVLETTCSVGYACYPFLCKDHDALSWEQVIDTADVALYAAKHAGRNRCAGVAATELTPTDALYTRINEDSEGMIARGELMLITGVESH